MTLHDLMHGVEVVAMNALPPPVSGMGVSGLHHDSRRILPGQVFFALSGAKTEGLRFVDEARRRGAIAVVSASAATDDAFPWIQVANPRRALAQAAANFYGHPSQHLELCGITGTNGKTTTSFLLYAILEAAGKVAGLFGTIQYRLGERRLAAPNTTPESLDLQAMLADLRECGGTHAVMEVSSHALAMDRVYATRFRVAVFTNLTRDHLDYHHTMVEYFAAKRRLFDGSIGAPPDYAVLNADDSHSRILAATVVERRSRPASSIGRVLFYGVESANVDLREEDGFILTPSGRIANRSKLAGRINSYNRLAAVGAAIALDIPLESIEQGLENLAAVPGRFESVDAGQPFRVIVDYAHTDDALRNVLVAARELKPKRIITVFGCGGDRDRKKRPLMGEAAARASDLVIVTSDNPRSEDPTAIIAEILPGVVQTGTPYRVEADRATAIGLAIDEAREGDLVLIAGKGHETYQVVGGETHPFDDRHVARDAILGRMK